MTFVFLSTLSIQIFSTFSSILHLPFFIIYLDPPFTLILHPCTLLPKIAVFFNWSHEVSRDFVVRTYDNPFRTVEMEIPIGSNVILDCTVVKPVSSDCHVWSASSSASNSTIIFSSSTCAHSFTLPVTGTASGNFNQTEYIVALPSGNLAVYNFSREQEGSYLCLIKRRTGLQQYKLYKLVAKNSESIVLVNIRTS